MNEEAYESAFELWVEDDPDSSNCQSAQECLERFKNWLQTEGPKFRREWNRRPCKHVLEHFQEVYGREYEPGKFLPDYK